MDQVACLRAVQNLIRTNAAVLVDGFTHQGEEREVHKVAVNVLVAPSKFYFFVTQVVRAVSESVSSRNVVETEKCTYNVVVHVADIAFAQQGEDIAYDTMSLDFRKLCDRFVAVLRDTRCFSALSPDNENKFRLLPPQRRVTVINSDHWWSDDQTGTSAGMLYATIEFYLEEFFAR